MNKAHDLATRFLHEFKHLTEQEKLEVARTILIFPEDMDGHEIGLGDWNYTLSNHEIQTGNSIQMRHLEILRRNFPTLTWKIDFSWGSYVGNIPDEAEAKFIFRKYEKDQWKYFLECANQRIESELIYGFPSAVKDATINILKLNDKLQCFKLHSGSATV